MDPTTLSALISLVIALLGVIVSVLTSRQQVSSQIESLRQSQFTEILKKRIETYPKLWAIVLTHTSNWNIAGKPHDSEWVSGFLSAINECHAEIGVYFSQSVYKTFHELRTALVDLEQKLKPGEKATQQEVNEISAIFSGRNHSPGLATHLKNDLGSYGYAAIQER